MKRPNWLAILCFAASAVAAGCTTTQSLGSTGNAVTCDPATPCPTGLSCISGLCESCGPVGGPLAPAIACKLDTDCPTGTTCIGGSCSTCTDPCTAGGGVLACPIPGADGGVGCKSDCDCPSGLWCVSGTCKTISPPPARAEYCPLLCTNDSQCASGSYCCNGKCEIDTLACSLPPPADAGTPVGLEAGTPPPACTSDAQSPSFDFCCNGKCQPSGLVCGPTPPPSDAGSGGVACGGALCAKGYYCCNNSCTVDTLPCSTTGLDGGTSPGACKVNSDCPFGEFCCTGPASSTTTTGKCQPSGILCPL